MFEWEERHRQENLSTHGVDFVRAARMFDGPVLEREDERQFAGERRFIALGQADGMFLVVITTPRGTRRRMVSAWRADQEDESIYRAAFPPPVGGAQGPVGSRGALAAGSRTRLLGAR
jgi:uncharacterized protein